MSVRTYDTFEHLATAVLGELWMIAKVYRDEFTVTKGGPGHLLLRDKNNPLLEVKVFVDSSTLDLLTSVTWSVEKGAYPLSYYLRDRAGITQARIVIGEWEEENPVGSPKINPRIFRLLDDLYESLEQDFPPLHLKGTDKVLDYSFTDLDYFLTTDAGVDLFRDLIRNPRYDVALTRYSRNSHMLNLFKDGEPCDYWLNLTSSEACIEAQKRSLSSGEIDFLAQCRTKWEEWLEQNMG